MRVHQVDIGGKDETHQKGEGRGDKRKGEGGGGASLGLNAHLEFEL